MSEVLIDRPLLVAKSALNAAAVTPDIGVLCGLLETTHYINWGTGVASGAVVIETADDPDYAGTWANVATITYASGAPKVEYVRVQGTYKVLRHRISTVLSGGTVTTRIVGAG